MFRSISLKYLGWKLIKLIQLYYTTDTKADKNSYESYKWSLMEPTGFLLFILKCFLTFQLFNTNFLCTEEIMCIIDSTVNAFR